MSFQLQVYWDRLCNIRSDLADLDTLSFSCRFIGIGFATHDGACAGILHGVSVAGLLG